MKILVCVAHVDDEILGAGGTICKHIENGDQVDVIIVTEASQPEWNEEFILNKIKEQKEVDEYLGIHRRFLMSIPSLDLTDKNIARFNYDIYKMIEEIKPDIIYTHFNHDLNEQHNIVSRAVLVATRIPNKATVYMFETPSTRFSLVPFKPDYYVSLNDDIIQKKLEAFSIYKSEVKEPPHPRSYDGIETLAIYRGDEIGMDYAEAFKTVRRIWK